MQASDPGHRAKRDDYSIRSPEPEPFFFPFFIHLYHIRRIRGCDARIYPPSIPVYIYLPPIRWRWAIDAWVRVLCPVCLALQPCLYC
jgi:hypothetical protein